MDDLTLVAYDGVILPTAEIGGYGFANGASEDLFNVVFETTGGALAEALSQNPAVGAGAIPDFSLVAQICGFDGNAQTASVGRRGSMG